MSSPVQLAKANCCTSIVAHYELIAFLFVPALILAVVAVFWVPPRLDGQGPTPEGARLRLLLVFVFLGAFLFGFAH